MLGLRMEAEMREQPLLLSQRWPHFDESLRGFFRGQTYDLIVLAARGSSDNAALYARYLLEVHLKIPVVLAAPSVTTKFGVKLRYPDRTLAVGVSQSGAAPDVSEVLEALKEDGHTTLAITNTRGSRITQAADHVLDLGVGKEESVAATKTYSSTLLAFYALARAFSDKLHCPALPDDEWFETCRSSAEAHLMAVLRNDVLFTLGRGYRFSSAQETALKLMECALLPCKAYSTADFEHGPKALAGHDSALIYFGDATASSSGADVIAAPQPKGTDPELMPIWDIFFGQWLALTAARARGYDPDHPTGLKKITETM